MLHRHCAAAYRVAPVGSRRVLRRAQRAGARTSNARAGAHAVRVARTSLALAAASPTPGAHTGFADAYRTSPAQAQQLVATLMATARPGAERMRDAGELVNGVSASGEQPRRRVLIAGFRHAKADLALVHHIAHLPREQAGAFLKDYLDEGAGLEAVVQWLALAGAALSAPAPSAARSARASNLPAARRAATLSAHIRGPGGPAGRGASRNLWNDLKKVVGDAVMGGGRVVENAVQTIGDALASAGKTLAESVASAASWTVAQVTDLVAGLLRAGESVASILAAAAAQGVAQLQKYVQALLAAGRSLGEVLGWAVGQVLATANAVIGKLLALGKPILDLVTAVLGLGRNALIALVKGVLAAGRTLSNLLFAVATQPLSTVQAVVDAALGAGQLLRSVLAEAAKLVTAGLRNVVSALLALGRSVKELLLEGIAAAGTVLNTLLVTLLALGRSMVDVLQATAQLAAASAKVVVAALLAIGRTLAELVQTVAGIAVAVAKVVFTALLALGKKVLDILVALGDRTLSAYRTALEAVLAMGVSLALLTADICTGVAEAFRAGFFEGLLALGKTPLQLLKAVMEVKSAYGLIAFTILLQVLGGYKPLADIPGALAQARNVYANAIDLDRVKIGFARLPGDVIRFVNVELPRAFTTMYLLNFGPGAKVDMQTIIHELAHVWQGVQEGPLYMTRALEAQLGAGIESLFHTGRYDDSAAYRVTEADLVAHGGDLAKFNPEQQASILEFFWIRRFADEEEGGGPYPWALSRGVVLPSEASLLPYAQVVNPTLKKRRPDAGGGTAPGTATAARARRRTPSRAPRKA